MLSSEASVLSFVVASPVRLGHASFAVASFITLEVLEPSSSPLS
jgi:hypothetical protein